MHLPRTGASDRPPTTARKLPRKLADRRKQPRCDGRHDIEARLRLNDTQRAALKALQEANGTAMGILSACPPEDTTTPPARLDAVEGRLDAMQQAVYLVSTALGDFYAALSDEQKAQFEAIGNKRTT